MGGVVRRMSYVVCRVLVQWAVGQWPVASGPGLTAAAGGGPGPVTGPGPGRARTSWPQDTPSGMWHIQAQDTDAVLFMC
jgi:hypothetical protein